MSEMTREGQWGSAQGMGGLPLTLGEGRGEGWNSKAPRPALCPGAGEKWRGLGRIHLTSHKVTDFNPKVFQFAHGHAPARWRRIKP